MAEDSAFSQIVRVFSLSGDDQSIDVYHLNSGKTYYYKVTSQNFKGETSELKRDSLRIDGQVRMLHLSSLHNARDLGGWPVKGGRYVKYGLLYRGGEMNGEHFIQVSDADVAELRQYVGIRTELDLRSPDELDLTPLPDDDIFSSALGSDISYRRVSIQPSVKIDSLQPLYKECFDYILSCLRQGFPVNFHCWGGADRTGTLAFLLCGLLGVSQSDLDKDYELTSFCDITGLCVRHSNRYAYKAMIELLEKQYSGRTLQDKIRNCFLKAGVSRHDIADFQRFMLSE